MGMESRRRYKRIGLISLLGLAALMVCVIRQTYVMIQQDRLNSALLTAIQKDNAFAVRMLLEQGADPNVRDVPVRHIRTLKDLWNAFWKRDTQNGVGWTALMLAESNVDMVRALLEHGANVNAKSEGGYTVLMIVIRAGYFYASRPGVYMSVWRLKNDEIAEKVVQILLEHGADVRVKDKLGGTPLLFAVDFVHPDTVQMFLSRGADVNAKDWRGSVLTYALRGKHRENAVLLKQAGAKE